MPELIAQTNMDQQSVNRLREELAKLTSWLGKNSGKYFASEYETPSQDYIEKARGIWILLVIEVGKMGKKSSKCSASDFGAKVDFHIEPSG